MIVTRTLAALACATSLTACMESAKLPDSASIGPTPQLPEPNKTLLPTVNIARAKENGWPANVTPRPAAGLAVKAFATGLDHPRWVVALPNGDVLVAESDHPAQPDENRGIRNRIMGFVMKLAGSGQKPSANRITLLRDTDGDGVADVRSVYLENLNSPFGMALAGNDLYVANTDAVVRFPYVDRELKNTGLGTKLTDLPAGTRNHHWTKNVIASADGSKLYVTVGSNSNVAENGMEVEVERAAIWEVDAKTGAHRIFASGLRNPNGMGWEPATGVLWTVANERDEIGSDLVPDYLTSVQDGAFYGWPYAYYGPTHVDHRVKPERPDMVKRAIAPDYALGTHVAPLGLAFSRAGAVAPAYASGAFIGRHGSWNRRPRSGYDVVFVAFANGKPSGTPVEILGGFVDSDGEAYGRPVGVAIDKAGGLLVADDVGNAVWRVTAAR